MKKVKKEKKNEKFESAEERHERGFQDVSIPWHVFDIIERRILKAIDVLMLITIHSFCKKGKCFASNKYLGERIGVGPDRAKQIITKLKKLGLVEQTSFDGRRRVLAVTYNMDPKTASRYAKTKPENDPSNQGNSQADREKTTRQTGRKLPGRQGENYQADREKITRIEYKEEKVQEKNIKRFLGGSQATPPKNEGSTLFCEANTSVLRSKPNPRLTEFDKKAAERLKQIVVENNETSLLSIKEETIAERIRRLREKADVEEKEIKTWIVWLREHYSDEDVAKFRRADDFFDHFKRHKDAMTRKQGGGFSSNGRQALTRENMWNEPSNVLRGGILRVEVDKEGRRYDGRLLYKIRRRALERFGRGRPVREDLKALLAEEFPEAVDVPDYVIGSVG